MQDLIQKDTSVVYSKHLSNFKNKPGANSKYLILRNLKALVEHTCQDASEFKTATVLKRKALGQLKHTIVIAEEPIREHFEYIIRTMIKLYTKEEGQLDDEIRVIAELLGIFTDSSLFVPIMIKILFEEEAASARTISNTLELFSYVIKNETPDSIRQETDIIVKALEDIENNHNENFDIMKAGYILVSTFLSVTRELASKYRTRLFSYLLTFQCLPDVKGQLKTEVEKNIGLLAELCGYKDIKELYSVEVAAIMKEYSDTKNFKSWTNYSKERYKFAIIVKNCGKGLADHLDIVLEVLESMVSPSHAELEMKIDALELVEFLINLPELHENIAQNSLRIMSKVLIPSAVWKAGKPYIKIRKASVICMIKLINSGLLSPENLFQCVSDLKPLLKSCLNDDWAPDLRYTSTVFLEALFTCLKDILPDLELKDLYPHLLERLDDAQDLIRIEVTKAIKAFFKCSQLKMSPSTLEYVVRTLLIHLDDQNEQLQIALFNALKEAAEINPKIVLTEARISVKKQKYPKVCEELIRWIEETQEEKMKEIEKQEKQEEADKIQPE